MQMDKKSFVVGVLSASALFLLIANLFVFDNRAVAQEAVKDRDYQLVTAPVKQGGDALYVTDSRTGRMVVFLVQNGRLQPVAARDVSDAFNGGRAAGARNE